jgi:hypothetical protein
MRLTIATLALLACAATARAQDPPKSPAPGRLQTLLHELAGTDQAAWAQHFAELERSAKALDDAAANLKQQAAKLAHEAQEKEAAAKAVCEELQRLRELQ